MVTVDGVEHTVPVTRVSNDDGTLTFTLKADSDQVAAAYLEGIAVLPTTGHFKGTVTANVLFEATREITSDEGVTSVIPLASAEKGPLTVRFRPGTRRRQRLRRAGYRSDRGRGPQHLARVTVLEF